MEQLTSRERVSRLLRHEEADRVALFDNFCSSTTERWHREGLPQDRSPLDYFDFDIVQISADLSLQLPLEVLEENDSYSIVRNSYGTTVKTYRHATSTPGWLDHTVKSAEDFRTLRGRFTWNPTRIQLEGAKRIYEKARAEGKFIVYTGAISWDAVLQIVGAETLLMSMYDDPDWIHDMFEMAKDLYLDGYKAFCALGFSFDGAWVYDDMAYNKGPLFSPACYDEFFAPRDREICDFFSSQGLPVILHSCGFVEPFLERIIAAGYACLQPVEAKAGMDLRALKEKYGSRISFMGGIDVRALAESEEAAEREIASKITAAKAGGGYIYHSDHSVPDDISFERYRKALELVRKYGRYEAAPSD